MYHCPILGRITNRKQKIAVAQIIQKKLKKTFDHNLLYNSDFANIIKASSEHLKLFEAYLIYRLEPSKPDALVKSVPLHFPNAIPIDRHIHLCYTYSHDIPKSLRRTIIEIDPYYKWILSGRFNYKKFNTEWLNHDLTKAMRSTLKKSNQLRMWLVNYLKNNQNEKVERAFFDIFEA